MIWIDWMAVALNAIGVAYSIHLMRKYLQKIRRAATVEIVVRRLLEEYMVDAQCSRCGQFKQIPDMVMVI